MFNRTQLNRLKDLSTKLYGVSSAWKRYDRSVPVAVDQTEEKIDTVAVTHKNGKRQVMSLEKALSRGLAKKEDVPETHKINKVEYIRPTFEQIETILLDGVDTLVLSKAYSQGEASERSSLFAQRYSEGTMKVTPFLLVDEDKKPEADKLLELLPETHKEAVKSLVSSDQSQMREGQVPFDALTFLSDLVFSFNHKDKAKEISDEVYQKYSLQL